MIKEPVSGFTHMFGALLGIAGLSVLVTLSARNATVWHVVSFAIFGSTMILLYTSSALYHLLVLNEKGELFFKRMDHIMIYMLIAGTYTPFCLVPLRGGWGFSILGVIWGFAVAGIFFKIFWINAPRWASTILYLVMGWVAIVAIVPLFRTVPAGGMAWLAAGGLSYSIGAVIYATKKPDPFPGVFGFHEIWHIFVLAGTTCHFVSMYCYLLLMP